MKNQIKIVDGFVWLLVTDKAKQLFETGLFELYVLHEDGSESLVGSHNDINQAHFYNQNIAIEVGWLPED